ncbi:hypothetical protein SAMN04488688_102534 [Paenibacillus sp. cl141a]|nr:hypothetical protein SAMN04488688_102534 [Paenibacillus sp. cl141a]
MDAIFVFQELWTAFALRTSEMIARGQDVML